MKEMTLIGKNKILEFFVILVFMFSLLIPPFFVFANLDDIIKQKENEINELNNKIENFKAEIKQKQEQAKSLEEKIKTLEKEIEKTNLEIQRTETNIEKTKKQIEQKEQQIEQKEMERKEYQKMLSEYVRELSKYDNVSPIEMIITSDSFSQFFDQIIYTKNLERKTFETTKKIRLIKERLEKEKEELEQKKQELETLYSTLEVQKQGQELLKLQREALLEKTRMQEEALKEDLSITESLESQSRQQLYYIKSEAGSITFQEAVENALFAEEKTGVRAALILAIIKQESNFGGNTGTGNYKEDMHPSEVPAFFEICQELGLNPEFVNVSKKPVNYKGWGGAMGYGQIMPTTWKSIKSKISELTRNYPPSPWNPKDAFTGTAILLKGNGADLKNPEDEKRAAGIYFAGGNWMNYQWYADQVMLKAEIYQELLNNY